MSLNIPEPAKKFEDPVKGKLVLLNVSSREELIGFPEMKESYDLFYPAYQPDPKVLEKIRPLLGAQKITIVLGTWCGDSKVHISNFFKLSDQLAIDEKKLLLICVDGAKHAENGLLDGLGIEKVPTIIVYEQNKELGRIVESPQTTLEDDLLTLLKR